jgi:hypothetical protein
VNGITIRGHRIELALHQASQQVYDGNPHASRIKLIGGFQPKQDAADYNRLSATLGGARQGVHVADVAKRDHPIELRKRHRDHERF